MNTEWIDVKSKLPEKDGKYLCVWNGITSSNLIDIFYFANNLKKIDKYDFQGVKSKSGWYRHDSEWGHILVEDVTHWMPLPQLPDVD